MLACTSRCSEMRICSAFLSQNSTLTAAVPLDLASPPRQYRDSGNTLANRLSSKQNASWLTQFEWADQVLMCHINIVSTHTPGTTLHSHTRRLHCKLVFVYLNRLFIDPIPRDGRAHRRSTYMVRMHSNVVFMSLFCVVAVCGIRLVDRRNNQRWDIMRLHRKCINLLELRSVNFVVHQIVSVVFLLLLFSNVFCSQRMHIMILDR